jgi:hypothetical protein
MNDVTWRTGCTFTILALLLLLGSGRLLEGPSQAPTPLPTGEDTSSESYRTVPAPPEVGTALPTGRGGASAPGATAKAPRPASHRLHVPQ